MALHWRAASGTRPSPPPRFHRLLLRTQVVTNEKGKSVRDQGRKVLQPVAEQGFCDPLDKSVRYVWLYKPPVSGWFTYLPVIVVLGILAVTMFPLWPMWLKRCVFWLSAALLVLLTAFLVLRYMLALLAWLAGFELWIIPRFWDEAATIVETFDPLISAGVDPTAAAALPYRGAVLALLLGVGYWAASAPEQVEGMVASQRAFVEDLYSGALMADASEVRLPGADRLGRKGGWGGSAPRVRAFDDIWKELEEEEQAEQEEGGDQGGEEGAGKDEALDEVDAEIPEATAPDVDGLAQEAAGEEQDVDVSDADIVAALLREQAAEQGDEAD